LQTLFLRIYGSVIVAISLVLLLTYFVFSEINHHRYQQHLAEQLSGTLYLIKQGIERQKDTSDRERWLELVASLMNVSLSVSSPSKVPNQINISLQQNEQNRYRVSYPINAQQQLDVTLNGVSEHLVTGTAFLLLNELGLYPAQQRQMIFQSISSEFNYPIHRVSSDSQVLDSEQLERLTRGEMVIIWQTEFDSSLSFDVFAPWGNSQDLLKLGTINVFEQYPTWLLVSGFAAVLVALALLILLILRLIVNRLTYIQHKVDAIEPELIEAAKMPEHLDVINQLTWKIDQMALRIKRLIAQKHQMFRAVSHDLRTPLSKAQFRLEALSIQIGVDNTLVEQTKADMNQLNLLIGDLLSYEKISESERITKETLELNHFIMTIVDGMTIVFPKVKFSFEAQNFCVAAINKQLFTRMLENLLNNAARFAESSVVVVLSSNDTTTVLDIIDDGPGVDEKSKAHIFEPFYQQDQSRSANCSGYGLGLAIVKQIVSQHAGEIELMATSQGAHFRITLPNQAEGEES